jgi:hypothetical protein
LFDNLLDRVVVVDFGHSLALPACVFEPP